MNKLNHQRSRGNPLGRLALAGLFALFIGIGVLTFTSSGNGGAPAYAAQQAPDANIDHQQGQASSANDPVAISGTISKHTATGGRYQDGATEVANKNELRVPSDTGQIEAQAANEVLIGTVIANTAKTGGYLDDADNPSIGGGNADVMAKTATYDADANAGHQIE